jgi:hypothetical protein
MNNFFKVQTPALVTAMGAFEHVIDQTKAGTIVAENGRNIVNAGKGIVQTVGQELKVRLAMPKLSELEAPAAA